MSYDKNTDYKSLADQAANRGDYTQAAKYEQQRNEKIDGEGLAQYAKTSDYGAYLPTYSSTVKNELGHAATDVANIKDFSYDPSTDNNAKAMSNLYTRQADRSARDAVSAAATQTGGLASSYAASAGAAAAQNYMAQLDDKYTDLYSLALQSWQANNSAKVGKLSALQGLNNDQYNIYNSDRANLQEKESAAYTQALQKWAASGVLDAQSAKVLGLKEGTLYSDYAQWKAQLAEARYEADLSAKLTREQMNLNR